MKEFILTQNEVLSFAKQIAQDLLKKNILCLKGSLGSGKTFLSSQIIRLLTENETQNVTSPTFNIVNEYKMKNEKSIYHFDLYRIKKFNELENIGLFDSMDNGICIIEWWDNFKDDLKIFLQDSLFIDIIHLDQKKRKFIYK